MAQRNVDIVVKAKDEATSVFHRIAHGAKSLNLDSRQGGDTAIERLARGGGALGIATMASESLDRVAKSLHEVQMGTTSWDEALTKMTEALPFGVGQAVTAFNSLGRVVNDGAASVFRYFGASEEYIEKEVADADTVKEKYEALNRVIDQLGPTLRKYKQEAALSDVNLRGTDRQGIEEEFRHGEELKKIRADEQAKLGELEKQGFAKNSSALRNVRRQFDGEIEDAERIHQNKLQSIQNEAAAQAEAREVAHEQTMGEFAAHAETARLKASGASLAAELTALQDAYAKVEAEAARHLKEMNKNATFDERQKNNANAGAESAERWRQLAGNSGELIKAGGEEQIDAAREQAERLKDTEAQTRAEQLRALGKDYEARREEINRQLEKENSLIEQKLNEQFSPEKVAAAKKAMDAAIANAGSLGEQLSLRAARDQYMGQAQAAHQSAAAQESANQGLAGQRLAGVGRDEAKSREDEQAEAHRQVMEIRIGFLRDEEQMGNKAAGVEAKRLEIAEKYTEEREKINKLLRDGKGLTDADRKSLSSQLGGLDAQQEMEMARSGKRDFTPFTAPGLSEAVSDPGDTGIRAAAMESRALSAGSADKKVEDPKAHSLLGDILKEIGKLVGSAGKKGESVFGHH